MRNKRYKCSYSQLGEDIIIKHIFDSIGVQKPSYIDIGAHDPYHISNTAFFYINGSRGINIEPNPILFNNIKKARKRDINLNIGIGNASTNLDFYVMNASTMSTFSKEQAQNLCSDFNFKIQQIINIEIQPVMSIIDKYWNGVFPDFLTLDAEGLDFEILKSIDYKRTSPKVICVETVEYSETVFGRKETEVVNFLKDQGYYFYADTGINSILVKK